MLAYSIGRSHPKITEVEAERYLAEDLRTSITATLHYRLIHRFSFNNSRVAAPHAPRAICRPVPLTRPPTSPTFLSSSRASSLATSSVALPSTSMMRFARHDALRR